MDLRKAFLNSGYNIPRQLVYQLISDFDGDESGVINFEEFVKMMVMSPCDQDNVDDIRRVFDQIDRDRKGFINVEDLRELALELREPLPDDKTLETMIKVCDPKNTGIISWENFFKFNKKKEFMKFVKAPKKN